MSFALLGRPMRGEGTHSTPRNILGGSAGEDYSGSRRLTDEGGSLKGTLAHSDTGSRGT